LYEVTDYQTKDIKADQVKRTKWVAIIRLEFSPLFGLRLI